MQGITRAAETTSGTDAEETEARCERRSYGAVVPEYVNCCGATRIEPDSRINKLPYKHILNVSNLKDFIFSPEFLINSISHT